MSKFNKETYLRAVKTILPNISTVNNTAGLPKINLPEVVRLVSEEWFLVDQGELTYELRLAFCVIKDFAKELREKGYYTFGDYNCEDLKGDLLCNS